MGGGRWVGGLSTFRGVGGIPDCLAHEEEKNWVKSWKNYKVKQRKKSVAKVQFKEMEEEKLKALGKGGKKVGEGGRGGSLTRMFMHTYTCTRFISQPAFLFITAPLLFVCFSTLLQPTRNRNKEVSEDISGN